MTKADFVSANVEIPSQTLAYTYDPSGNRTVAIQNGTTETYVSNEVNQYTRAGAAQYDYDPDGNLIRKTQGGRTWRYEYDNRGRLSQVDDGNGQITSYQYDALGNRQSATVNGVTTTYLVDPFGLGNVVGEYTAGNSTRYVHGLGLVSLGSGSDTLFYDFNSIGSTIGLTDAAGAYRNRYEYQPFGAEIRESEGVANPFEFVGRYGVMEETHGLDFMRARYYDSQNGRFTAMDPIGLQGGDANFYRYARNDTINLNDPSGLILKSTPYKFSAFPEWVYSGDPQGFVPAGANGCGDLTRSWIPDVFLGNASNEFHAARLRL